MRKKKTIPTIFSFFQKKKEERKENKNQKFSKIGKRKFIELFAQYYKKI